MGYTIPTQEPVLVRCGDSWQWTRALSDYPASTWTLTYTLYNASDAITIVASADGDTHSVDVAPATTTAYTSGRYEWLAKVSDGTDTHTIAAGVLIVAPEITAATDTRSHARKMLDALNALLEGRASDGDVAVVSSSINDRSITRDIPSLIKLRDKYAQMVASEDAARNIARGDGTMRNIRVRFVS